MKIIGMKTKIDMMIIMRDIAKTNKIVYSFYYGGVDLEKFQNSFS